jgi:hypothetical protein
MSGKKVSAEVRVGFISPNSQEDAREQCRALSADIELIKGQLANKIEEDFLDFEGYRRWKASAGIALSHKKTYKLLLETWITNNRVSIKEKRQAILFPSADPTPIQVESFWPPVSVGRADAEADQLTAKIMEFQGQLAVLKNPSFPRDQKEARRSEIIVQMRPLELRRQSLNAWVRGQLKLERVEVDTRVKALGEKVDSANPISALFHGEKLLWRFIKEFKIPLTPEDRETMDAMHNCLREHGYEM